MARLWLAVAIAALLSSPAAADCSDGRCLPGGGDPALDCAAEFFGAGLRLNHPYPDPGPPAVEPTEIRCFDGDAGCDLDGTVDGVCTFGVDVCLHNDDPNLPACTPGDVTSVAVSGTGLDAAALEAALGAIPLPVTGATCTDGATVRVELANGAVPATRELQSGSVGVTASVAGGDDESALALTCVPRGWPSHGYDAFNHRATEDTSIRPANAAQLTLKWDFPLGSPVSSTPTVAGDVVYASSWNGLVYALDRETGTELWSFDTEATQASGSLGVQSSVTVLPDGRVVVGDSEANVYALDGADGRLLWETSVGDPSVDHLWASPTVANGRVLMGVASHNDQPCTQGRMVALDVDTGAELWTTRTAPDRICEDDTTQGCTLDMDCPSGRCVGMCVGDTNVPCQLDADCGENGPCGDAVGGGITATPATDVTGEIVYMASVGCFTSPRVGNSDRIFRLDATDGAVVWALPDFPTESFGDEPFQDYGVLNGPILVNDATNPQLLTAGKDGFLRSQDPATGAEIWTNDVGSVNGAFGGFGLFNGAPAFADGRIFTSLYEFGDGGPDINHAQSFDTSDGSPVWEGSIDIDPTFGSVGVGGGVVFVGSSDLFLETGANAFYAFDAADGTWLQTFELPVTTSSGPSMFDDELFIGYGGILESGGVRAYEVATTALEKDAQKCVLEIQKRHDGAWKALTNEASRCVKDRAKGKTTESLSACVALDGKGKIAKARAKLVSGDEKRCGTAPTFGYEGEPDPVADVAEAQAAAALEAIFGTPDALVTKAEDKAGAACQGETIKNVSKLIAKAGSESRKAEKAALSGKGGAPASGRVELAAAVQGVGSAPKVAKAVTKLADKVGAKCAGLDVPALFPGLCGADADFAGCAARCALYHHCQAQAVAGLLPLDCAAYAGGACRALTGRLERRRESLRGAALAPLRAVDEPDVVAERHVADLDRHRDGHADPGLREIGVDHAVVGERRRERALLPLHRELPQTGLAALLEARPIALVRAPVAPLLVQRPLEHAPADVHPDARRHEAVRERPVADLDVQLVLLGLVEADADADPADLPGERRRIQATALVARVVRDRVAVVALLERVDDAVATRLVPAQRVATVLRDRVAVVAVLGRIEHAVAADAAFELAERVAAVPGDFVAVVALLAGLELAVAALAGRPRRRVRQPRRRVRRERDRRRAERGRGREIDAMDLAAERVHQIELAGGVLAERGPGVLTAVRARQLTALPLSAAGVVQRPDGAEAEVREQVRTDVAGRLRAAIDEATGDRAPVVVVVLVERRLVRGIVAAGHLVPAHLRIGVPTERPLHDLPAVVAAPEAVRRLAVDLLDVGLADVSDPEVAAGAVERETPRVAETPRPDLVPRAVRGACVRIVVRDRVVRRRSAAGVDVDPEDLAEPVARILRPAARVVSEPAVAERDVEHPVRPELDLAAVVVRVRLRQPQQHRLGRIRDVRVRRHLEPRDDRREPGPGLVRRVVHEEAPVRRVVGVERDRQEAPLLRVVDPVREIEERRRQERVAVPDPELPLALDDEEPGVPRVGQVDRLVRGGQQIEHLGGGGSRRDEQQERGQGGSAGGVQQLRSSRSGHSGFHRKSRYPTGT